MTPPTHTREQGVRVHYLANLGGLMAVAGLDHHPPDFLLGILLIRSRAVGWWLHMAAPWVAPHG